MKSAKTQRKYAEFTTLIREAGDDQNIQGKEVQVLQFESYSNRRLRPSLRPESPMDLFWHYIGVSKRLFH